MSEARDIELKPIADRVGPLDLVVIAPNDPEAMLRHTHECRDRGIPFAADPSQQLAFSDGEMIRDLIDGATILLSNEYEAALMEQKTGWTADDILEAGRHPRRDPRRRRRPDRERRRGPDRGTGRAGRDRGRADRGR